MSRLKGITKDRKIYGNCQVFSPDNILIFRCDEKKAYWYIDRDLGEIIDNDPLKVRLTFEPNGLGNHDKDFGLSEMSNSCVVCGCEDFLTKHHVVPSCYRKHFPLELKSHNFHDVLSICVDCHEEYERHADKLKLEIGKQYNSPINGIVENDISLTKCVGIARAIINVDTIPKKRIKVMRDTIKEFLGIKRLTKNRLEKLSNVKSGTIVKKSHGEIVVEQIVDIEEFIQLWRTHFVDIMEPKHLPENWKIDN